MIKGEFKQFVGLTYNFSNGPSSINGNKDLKEALNCQSLIHRIYQMFRIPIPPGLLSKEIYEDKELFFNLPIDNLNVLDLAILDVFILGRQHEQDFRKLHLGLFIGEADEMQNPLIIHATAIDRQVSIWSLQKFFNYPRYERLYAIKRPKINGQNWQNTLT